MYKKYILPNYSYVQRGSEQNIKNINTARWYLNKQISYRNVDAEMQHCGNMTMFIQRRKALR